MDIKTITKGLTIAGAIGSLLTVTAAIIKAVNPAASDIPMEYRHEIKKLVDVAVDAKLKNNN